MKSATLLPQLDSGGIGRHAAPKGETNFLGRIMSASNIAGLGKARVEALTDGVFAIAMTLMVFHINIPELSQRAARWALSRKLLDLWPSFLIYAISFMVLGIYWVGHHNHFHYVRRTNRISLWINLAFLFSVTLIPFSTALLGRYPAQRAAVVMYGLNLIVVGLLLYLHFWYARGKGRLLTPTWTRKSSAWPSGRSSLDLLSAPFQFCSRFSTLS